MEKKYLEKKLTALALAGVLTFSVGGCGTELGSDKSDMDVLSTTDENVSDLSKGVVQEKEVDGEDFKLVIEYFSETGSDWRITDTKRMWMQINTSGLSSSLEVYIDNVHTDTSIVSEKSAIYSGILQDTMDDRIHNSLMLGFPISDTVSYLGCNVIEGQNSEFIEGWTHGYNGSYNTAVETKRYKESDYLKEGVYYNQIDSVIDLIVVDKNTNEKRTVSVFSNILVEVNHRITFKEGDKLVTYEYDKNGNSKKVDECEIQSVLKLDK